MKKIKLSLNLGIISRDNYGKELIVEHLKQIALNYNINKELADFLIVLQNVPIKLKLINGMDFNQFINNYISIKKIDVLINIVDVYDLNSTKSSNSKDFEDFKAKFMFKGISIFLGVDRFLIENEDGSNQERISTIDLIKKTKELGFLYCFEIQSKNQDLLELFNKIFDTFILKLGNINPELLKNAISYGKTLKKHINF